MSKETYKKSNATVVTVSVPVLWKTSWLPVPNTDIRNP